MATQAVPAQVTSGSAKKRIRKVFGNIHEVVQMPNLIEVQRESYEQFLRSRPEDNYVSGLEKTLRSVFPIRDFAGTAELDFVNYELEPPKFDTDECRQRGITYAAPMRVTLRLIVFEVDPDTETRSVLDIKEQDVYMGDMPLMTGNGTFIVNGTERVIVSQMHRSPGVLFDHDRGKTHASRQVSLRRPRHPLSRLVARFRVRRQGHRQRPHRPEAQAPGDDFALRAGPERRGHPQPLLQDRDLYPGRGRLEGALPAGELARPEAAIRCRQRRFGRGDLPGRHQGLPARRQQGGQGRARHAADPDRGDLRPLFRVRSHQRNDRPHLYRGGRRGDAREPRDAGRRRHRDARAARHRSCLDRARGSATR